MRTLCVLLVVLGTGCSSWPFNRGQTPRAPIYTWVQVPGQSQTTLEQAKALCTPRAQAAAARVPRPQVQPVTYGNTGSTRCSGTTDFYGNVNMNCQEQAPIEDGLATGLRRMHADRLYQQQAAQAFTTEGAVCMAEFGWVKECTQNCP